MDTTTPPPWQLCDTACRIAMTALKKLDGERVLRGVSFETLAAQSGMHPLAVTRIMHGGGGNLAEFICLARALTLNAGDVLNDAAELTVWGQEPVNAA